MDVSHERWWHAIGGVTDCSWLARMAWMEEEVVAFKFHPSYLSYCLLSLRVRIRSTKSSIYYLSQVFEAALLHKICTFMLSSQSIAQNMRSDMCYRGLGVRSDYLQCRTLQYFLHPSTTQRSLWWNRQGQSIHYAGFGVRGSHLCSEMRTDKNSTAAFSFHLMNTLEWECSCYFCLLLQLIIYILNENNGTH